MSYFAIQVRTGSEIEVKEMMTELLSRTGYQGVQSIYAMETYTEIVSAKTDQLHPHELTSSDISDHLYSQRLQVSLSNLRVAYEHIQDHHDSKSINIKEEYREQIKAITSKLKNIRNDSKKISSVLPGYILLELDNNFHYLPSHLYHMMVSIPKVSGIPSRMNIPEQEVSAFLKEVAMSAEVELQFDEILSYQESKKKEENLLHEANECVGTEREKELLRTMDDMDTDLEQEINDLKPSSYPIIERIKAWVKNKRKTVTMPVSLFYAIYQEAKGAVPAKYSSSDFIHRLRRWIQKHEVVLE
ncbi:transcription termination/antitermination NusG family protein [Lentibacillus cibarius]|uniref:NusG-like N-terminal domain-containing protein n=1 Tax=Lentibacillus cibarius TaxID=2583219 RepID=A0A5S3QIB9_9BACI|nr:transcription termination/antitermination NusG family protein [Lentibacillus cibarius]TMN20951.1 hypothetical protein FFL34_01615 [Lentibacillus cibarius]